MKKIRTAKRGRYRLIFFVYLLVVVRLIIFKYPFEQLLAIARGWEKGVILEGLDHANFTLFKTIRIYIDYAYKLNSFENLVGNVVVFIPFGFLLPYVMELGRNFFVMLFNAFLFVLGIEVFQLFSAFGAFDVDDILLNCAGAVIGYFLFLSWEGIFGCRMERAHEQTKEGAIANKQMDIRQADIRQADIRQADIRQADIRQADIRQTDIRQTDIRQADIRQR